MSRGERTRQPRAALGGPGTRRRWTWTFLEHVSVRPCPTRLYAARSRTLASSFASPMLSSWRTRRC